MASILIPLMIAGCPFDDAPDDLSAWMQYMNCPHECVNCYHEFMGYDEFEGYGSVQERLGAPPDPAGAEVLPGGAPDEDEGDDSTDTPPGKRNIPRVPDSAILPKGEPHPNIPRTSTRQSF